MLDLRTFGGLELRRGEGDPSGAVVLQTKRLALLAYLASAPVGQFRRRDAILALFWPDLDQRHAQGSLRQAVYALRKSLGDGVIVTRSDDEIGLDASLIRSDANRLESALRDGAPDEAIGYYGGDFLEGVFVADAAPELEEWVGMERAHLRSLAARAAWAAAEATRDRAAGGVLVRRAVVLSGYDEHALRRGVALLDGWGDRAGALALHRQTADRFRRDLKVGLSDETEATVARIRDRRSDAATAIPVEPGAGIIAGHCGSGLRPGCEARFAAARPMEGSGGHRRPRGRGGGGGLVDRPALGCGSPGTRRPRSGHSVRYPVR